MGAKRSVRHGHTQKVEVVSGLLTVGLEFGGRMFDSAVRWPEVAVEGTALTPRQPITAVPQKLKVPGAGGGLSSVPCVQRGHGHANHPDSAG